MTTPEPEPTFAVPLSALVNIEDSGDGTWTWGCRQEAVGAWFIPSRAEAESAAIAHLADVHGLAPLVEETPVRVSLPLGDTLRACPARSVVGRYSPGMGSARGMRHEDVLSRLLAEGVTHGDSLEWLPKLPAGSVDLFFTSPPYADARAYSRIHPDHYVEWFLPFAKLMLDAVAESGNLVINIKNRVASRGPLRGQRHPYVYQLVLALQEMGWRWIETYIWAKPNAVPGRFGPRTKDSFEYVYHFARGAKPYFDLDAVRVPYKADEAEIARRNLDRLGRRTTGAGFGRDRTKTYRLGGADPGNVVSVPQTYNQYKGVAHTAAMPEGLAEFFVKAMSPVDGVVIDPFAGGGTTTVVARRLRRRAGGFEIHNDFVNEARRRISLGIAEDTPGTLLSVM